MKFRFVVVVLVLAVSSVGWGAPPASYGDTDLLRDAWGTPHVFSDTDAGSMYGLGYACAEDRGFQMYYFLRMMQGRLAEVVGDVAKVAKGSPATAAEQDALMRAFGFALAAERVVANLDAETLAFLEAYSLGVNAFFAEHPEKANPLFEETGLEREPWTPQACILSWWHLSQFFAKNGLNDTPALERPERLRAMQPQVAPDDDAAVVRREDVTDEWIAAVDAFVASHGMLPEAKPGPDDPDPKFSHAWVVGGQRSTTGSAVLVSDPQTPVWNPSLLYEFHVSGDSFNVRGIGVAGSPQILIGFNEHVAWGMTALGADQADLFLLATDADHPNQYEVDGTWLDMTVREETIHVMDGEARTITLRETIFGPVVSPWVRNRPDGAEFALARVPVAETDRETIQAAWPMFRAASCEAFAAALPKWRFPTANCIFGDTEGNIGYWSLGAMPVRSALSRHGGDTAQDGSTRAGAWQGMIPYDLLPHVLNPKRGYLVSANHRSIQSFYRMPFGVMTGAGGDTDRGLRIKERIEEHLEANSTFTPEDVLAIQDDCVNVWKREIARIGFTMYGRDDARLSREARNAVTYLADWYEQGCHMDTRIPGTELAERMSVIFRGGQHAIVGQYGGGVSGLARFAKATRARYEGQPDVVVTEAEADFANRVLATAWHRCKQAYPGENPANWHAAALREWSSESIAYQRGLDGFPGLDPDLDMPVPLLTTRDGGTILSQKAQSYTQYVPLHDVDASFSILPPGSSERPGDPARFSTHADWARGELHPAPLSRGAVEEIAVSFQTLAAKEEADESDSRPTRGVARRQNSEAAPKPLPGKRPEDPVLESAIRYLNRKERTPEEVTRKLEELRDYVASDTERTRELREGFVLFLHLMRESQAGNMRIVYGTPDTLRQVERFQRELTKE